MKKITLLSLMFLAISEFAFGQYIPYHRENLDKHKEKKIKSFIVENIDYSYGVGSYYRPQKFQGLQVIAVNRPGGTHDDVYFIDKQGNAQYHTVRPTAPANLNPNRLGSYDSTNPSGLNESMGQALIGGVATLISGWIKN